MYVNYHSFNSKKITTFLFVFFIQFLAIAQSKIKTYEEIILSVHQKQLEFGQIYKKSLTIKQKDSIIQAAEFYIYKTIVNEFFTQWYGTPWSFYGQTRTPKYGSIACGYFVTTVLYDAGFDIPRVEWAQLASEVFIKKFSKDIKRFRDEPIENIKNYVLKKVMVYILLDLIVMLVLFLNTITQLSLFIQIITSQILVSCRKILKAVIRLMIQVMWF